MVRKMAHNLGVGLLPCLRHHRIRDVRQGSPGNLILDLAPGEGELLKHSRVEGT